MNEKIIKIINDSISVKSLILEDKNILDNLQLSVESVINAYKRGNKLLLCGNGGSAADAQHIAAELSGRFNIDRDPLFAEALHVNSSYVTAVANDYGYENVYSRMLKAMGMKGDVLIAISTSGNSENIVNAVIEANKLGIVSICFTGKDMSKLSELCNISVKSPSNNTARVQESHILFGHILCEIIEKKLF